MRRPLYAEYRCSKVEPGAESRRPDHPRVSIGHSACGDTSRFDMPKSPSSYSKITRDPSMRGSRGDTIKLLSPNSRAPRRWPVMRDRYSFIARARARKKWYRSRPPGLGMRTRTDRHYLDHPRPGMDCGKELRQHLDTGILHARRQFNGPLAGLQALQRVW